MYEDYIKMKIYFFSVSVYSVHQNIYREYIKNRGKIHEEKISFSPIFIMFFGSSNSLMHNNVYLFIKNSFYLKILSFQLNIFFNKFDIL